MKKINILWTGGWDSTFQLLQLILIQKVKVIPYYLIDAERPSTGKEILTMKRIRKNLFEKYPFTKDLLDSIRYFNIEDIAPNKEISDALLAISKEKHVGSQYGWLARFCNEFEINDMYLSIEMGLVPDFNHFLGDADHFFKRKEINSETVYYIDKSCDDKNYYKLLKYFIFPIILITKSDMERITKDQGIMDIMQLTWFCHYPIKNKVPCGKCIPCLTVMKGGFGWRIPRQRRIISYYYTLFYWPLKSLLRSALVNAGLWKEK